MLRFERLTKLNELDETLYNQILDLGITITMNLESMYYGTSATRIADIDEEIMDSVAKNYKEKLL